MIEKFEDKQVQDGIYNVPLMTWADDEATKIGDAVVTVFEGQMSAVLAIDDTVANDYGIQLMLVEHDSPLHMSTFSLVAQTYENPV